MINVTKLSYGFPQKELYTDISFTLEQGQHAALIGTNGTGKSTLVNLLMAKNQYLYEGKIEYSDQCRIEYVSQFCDVEKTAEVSLFSYVAERFMALQQQMDEICTELEHSENAEDALERYQTALDCFDAIGGDTYESDLRKQLALARLGKYEDAPLSILSSGQLRLVQIIKAMATAPNLLIMDEPDAFLDFDLLGDLENLIRSYPGTLLVITHNRHLLQTCFHKILQIEDKQLREFDGSYADYCYALLLEKTELQEQALLEEQELVRNKQMAERMRALATEVDNEVYGRSVHARDAIIARLEARKTQYPFLYANHPNITFPMEPRSAAAPLLVVKDYAMSFGDPLLHEVSFSLSAGEKVAIVGKNGTGKTTLLNSIINNDHPAISLGDDTELACFSPLHEARLTPDATPFSALQRCGLKDRASCSILLKQYGLSPDLLEERLSQLSGGERTLFALARISLSHANLLILDEPINHLDIYARQSFERAMDEYTGGVLMVSHDYYTIANCVDYVLLVENGTLRKISNRRFRKMIYAKHFTPQELALDQRRKELENTIEACLKRFDHKGARASLAELEQIIKH